MKKNNLRIDNKKNMNKFNMQNFTKHERRLLMSKKLLLLALVAFLCMPFTMAAVTFSELEPIDIGAIVNSDVNHNNERLDVTTFPWTEDFEGATFPPTDWTVQNDAAPNTISQGTENHTAGGSHCLEFNTSQTTTLYQQITVTPLVHMDNLTIPYITFWAKRYADTSETFLFGIGTDNTNLGGFSWYNMSPYISSDLNWNEVTLNLTGLTGNLYFGIGVSNAAAGGSVGIDDVSIYDGGALSGTVTLDNGGDVTLVDITFNGVTTNPDANGVYDFFSPVDVTSDLTAVFPGYADYSQTAVTITAGSTNTVDFTMNAVTGYVVSGFVDANDNPNVGVDGATVTISNAALSYSGTTDASGNYSIANVAPNTDLNLIVSQNGYMPYSVTINISADHTEDVTINEIVAVPGNVVATAQGDDMNVTWDAVLGDFVLDNGTVDGQLGFSTATANSVMGTLFMNNALIEQVSWYLTDESGPHDNVNILILGANANAPDINNILYHSATIANTDGQWNTHTLPQPISAPNGFFVGVQYNGFVALALDDHDQTNNTPGTQWAIHDYTDLTGAPSDISGSGFYGHFLMRAHGADLGPVTRSVTRSSFNADNNISYIENRTPYFVGSPEVLSPSERQLIDFSVYRFAEADMDNMANWTLLTDNETNTNYLDTSWNTLTAGIYYYAVSAEYTTGTSAPTISDWVAADMDAIVTVEIGTDSGDPIVGTEVRLSEVDGDHSYTANVTTGNSVTFPSVWRSRYDVVVNMENHSMEMPIENYNCTSDSVHIVALMAEDRMTLDYMTATINNSAVDLEWFAVQSGFENVLLVDDDASAYNTSYVDVTPAYQALFNTLGIQLTVIDLTTEYQDGPDAATMLPYDLVIWDTGACFSDGRSLSDNDHTNLAAYLNNGGKLILSAPEYLYDRFTGLGAFSAGDFPYDYLGVASATQDAITLTASATLNGAAGSYVDGYSVNQGVNLHIQDMDTLVPNNNGMVFATVVSGGNYDIGVQTANTIFFAGSLSGLEDGTNTVVEFVTAAMAGLSTASRNDRSFTGYKIMRNGEELVTGIQGTTFTDDAPVAGTNAYEVYAEYSSGNSNTVTASVHIDSNGEEVNQFKDEVYGNYPNPFNPTTQIKFSLAKAGNVEIDIYNIKGQKVKTLLNEKREAGQNSVVWNGTDDTEKSVGSGVYFYKVKASTFTTINKMIMLK